jgi:integrase/ribosomal protein L37E
MEKFTLFTHLRRGKMAINLHCSECKSSSSIRSKRCSKCGYDFSKDRKYRVVVKAPDGKRISKVLDSITKAKKFEGKIKAQTLDKNLFGIDQACLIDDCWGKYLEWAKENKKSWQDDKERWERHIEPLLKGKRMDQIISFDIQSLLDTMKSKKPYAPATLKQVLILVKRIYNWSAQMGLYDGKNPGATIKIPKLNNEKTECLTKKEIRRLHKTLDEWWNTRAALFVKFALYTGMRRGEIFGLTWENVDLENGIVILRNTKGGKDESLPISDEALKIILKAKKLMPHRNCPYVFPNRWGEKRSSLGNTWTKIKASANLPPKFRFHGLRHTYASYLASSGKVSQYTLQKLLTHKSPQMTQRYAHLFDQTLREGANLLPTLF